MRCGALVSKTVNKVYNKILTLVIKIYNQWHGNNNVNCDNMSDC
jgi:hypothetical protein